jgi:hypothetical protein
MIMRRRTKTFATGLVFVLGGATAGMTMISGTATAAQPIVLGSCSTSVQGAPGTPILLAPSAVLGPVVSVVKAVPLLGPGLAGTVSTAVSGMGNIPVGTIPAANTTISGSTIAAAAVPRIKTAISGVPLIGTVLSGILGNVQGALTSGCGIVVTVVNTVAAPVQEGAKVVAGAVEQGVAALPPLPVLPVLPGATSPSQPKPVATNPGVTAPTPKSGGSAPAVVEPVRVLPGVDSPVLGGLPTSGLPLIGSSSKFTFGRAPMADYSTLPFAKAGLFTPSPGVRYGGTVSGYTPQFGILGAENGGSSGVQAAGHADTLSPVSGSKIAFPTLLAVLALSGVTAALVRTWVLRRTLA